MQPKGTQFLLQKNGVDAMEVVTKQENHPPNYISDILKTEEVDLFNGTATNQRNDASKEMTKTKVVRQQSVGADVMDSFRIQSTQF